MAIDAAKRKALPADKFALPAKKAYPVDTAARTRNAAARLEQNKGDLSATEYAEAKRNIAKAAKRFGIKSEYAGARKMDLGVGDVHVPGDVKARRAPPRTLHVRADLASGGSLHVRHMSDAAPGSVLCGNALDRNAPDATGHTYDSLFNPGTPARLKWVQYAKVGQWAGHPSGFAFQLTTKEFAEIRANFYATANRLVPVDFGHCTELDPTSGSLPETGAPAQGWIREIDNRNDLGLWCLTEWKPDVGAKIATGEFQFVSPAIRFNAKDRVTNANIGARMSSAAITNVPFLDGMRRIAASDAAVAETITLAQRPMVVGKSHDFMSQARSCLKLDDAANADEMKAKIANLRGLYSDAADAGGDAHSMCQGVDMSAYTTALSGLMGAPVNMDIGDLLDAVEEMIDAAMARHVAEYHAGEEPADAALDDDGDDSGADMVAATDTHPAPPGTNKEAAMADAEQTKKLADLETEKTTLMTERTTLLTERDVAVAKVNKLELELQKATATVETQTATIVALTDANGKRENADRSAAVDDAFDTYKDAQKLTDAHKRQMMSFLMSDGLNDSNGAKRIYPAFNGNKALGDTVQGLYPRIEAGQRHLLHNIAGAGAKPTLDAALLAETAGTGVAQVFSMSDLANELIASGWDVERAQLEADRRFRQMREAAR